MSLPATKPNILLSAYTGLGNFVLKTPLIAALHEAFPHIGLDLIAGNGFGAEQVLGNNSPLLRHVHQLPLRASWQQKLRFFWALRSYNYDYLLLPFDADHRFLRIGAAIAGIKRVLRHSDKTLLLDRHEIDLNLDLLEQLLPSGNTIVWRTLDTFVQYEPDQLVLSHWGLAAQQYIVLQLGAANGLYAAKVWLPGRFEALIAWLLKNYRFPIVLVGDVGDNKVFVEPVAAAFVGEKRLINTAGRTDFGALVNLLAQARAVVCHDSGVMHLADALRTPLLALYGPTDYKRTHPRRHSSHTLLSDTPYKGIMRGFATDEAALQQLGIGHSAMDGISVAMVVEKLASLLDT